MKVLISADSTCDLSAALREKFNIGIVPLYIEREGKNYRDGGVCSGAACVYCGG